MIFCRGEMPPLETSSQSQPRAFSARPNSTVLSTVQLSGATPSSQSVAETRTPTGRSAGNAARTASKTSSGKRIRLASEPP